MGRNIEIDARRGGGAPHEILFGEVTIQATALHHDGTKTVFPDDTTVGISNGVAVLENVDVSPAGPEPAWAYRMTFRNSQTGRGWSELVGVPAGTSAVKYPTLPRFTTAIPPETTKAELQNWVATTEAAKNTAVQAAATATAPTDAMVAGKINDPASLTGAALSAAIGEQVSTPGTPARVATDAVVTTAKSGMLDGITDQMHAQAFPSLSPDVPTISSYGPTNTPSVTPRIEYPYDTAVVRLMGANKLAVTQLTYTLWQNQGLGDNGGTGRVTPWSVEFATDSADIHLRLRQALATGVRPGRYRIYVDGRPVSHGGGKVEWTNQSIYFLRLQFDTARRRHIRVYIDNLDFGGVVLPEGKTAWLPPKTEQIRAAFIGDSWGVGGFGQNDAFPNNQIQTLGRLLGWETMQSAYGGCGYIAGASPYTNATRAAAVQAFNPHYIFYMGGVNDRANSEAAIQAAAAATFSDFKTRLPNARGIVVGPQPMPDYLGTGLTGARNGIKTAALAATNVTAFVDPMAENWLDGMPPAFTNDGLHLRSEGGAYYAKKIALSTVLALTGKGYSWREWDGPAI